MCSFCGAVSASTMRLVPRYALPKAPRMVTAATRAHILAALDVVIAGNVEIPAGESQRLDWALRALLRRVYGDSLPAQLAKTG
jgi:hypothetical protein